MVLFGNCLNATVDRSNIHNGYGVPITDRIGHGGSGADIHPSSRRPNGNMNNNEFRNVRNRVGNRFRKGKDQGGKRVGGRDGRGSFKGARDGNKGTRDRRYQPY